mmetsp:Transcript_106909/g.190022  ORF Transcript_106909/g.190022 Transcript_106909/m.190022 type:complete len:442 (-) Transcript_106909:60-1385(-)
MACLSPVQDGAAARKIAEDLESSVFKGKWLDGTRETSEAALPVKAKPQGRAEPLDPWQGKQLKPAAAPAENSSSAGASWGAFFKGRREAGAVGSPTGGNANVPHMDRKDREAGPQSQHFSGYGRDNGSRNGYRDRQAAFGRRGPMRTSSGGFVLDDERISHCLGRILRYHQAEYKLDMDEDGFISVSSLLETPDLRGASLDEVCRVVANSVGSRGKRFELHEFNDSSGQRQAKIRAKYRHEDGRPPRSNGGGRWPNPDFGRNTWHGSGSSRGHASMGFSPGPAEDDLDYAGRKVPAKPKRDVPSFTMSASENDEDVEAFDIEDEFAALSKPRGAVPEPLNEDETRQNGKGEEARKSNSAAAPSARSASTTASSSLPKPEEEVWERFVEPSAQKVWFWNPSTEEVLWADDPNPSWEMFFTETGQRWWWQEKTGRYFFEEAAL